MKNSPNVCGAKKLTRVESTTHIKEVAIFLMASVKTAIKVTDENVSLLTVDYTRKYQ